MVTATPPARVRIGVALAGLATVTHVAALYWPRAVATQVPDSDKLGHLLLFAVPVYLVGRVVSARWARAWWWVPALFALHAPLSEVLQGALLSQRTGDVWDCVADLVGVALGVVALVVGERSRR